MTDILVFGVGTSTNVRRWLEALAGAGASVVLATFEPHEEWPTERTIRLTRRAPGRLRYFTAAPQGRRLVRELQPTWVAGYYASGYGTLARLSGGRVLQVVVGSDVLAIRNHFQRRVVATNLSRAQVVLSWAPHLTEAVVALGVPALRVVTLPRGIPVLEFVPGPRPEAGPVRFITTRSLEPFYRTDVLLRAFAVAARSSPDLRLTITGEGPQRSALERLVSAEGVTDRVDLVGQISNADLPKVLAAHQAYASAAPSDGVSASLLEAMRVGLVPVVPGNDANRWWIMDGHNGVLFDRDDPDAIAAALTRAARDIGLRRRAHHHNPMMVAERADMNVNARELLHCLGGRLAPAGTLPGGPPARRTDARTPARSRVLARVRRQNRRL